MTKQKKFLTCDGNQAAAHVRVHVQRGSRVSTLLLRRLPMAEYVDEWAANRYVRTFSARL